MYACLHSICMSIKKTTYLMQYKFKLLSRCINTKHNMDMKYTAIIVQNYKWFYLQKVS